MTHPVKTKFPAQADHRVAEFLAELPGMAASAGDQAEFGRTLVGALRRFLDAAGVWIWANLEGEWTELAGSGGVPHPPQQDRLAQALDSEELVRSPVRPSAS